jgi:serine protease
MYDIVKVCSIATLASLLMVAAIPAKAANSDSHRLIIKFRGDTERTAQGINPDRLQQLANRSGHQLSLLRQRADGIRLATLTEDGFQPWREALQDLNSDPAVEYAIEDKRMRPQFIPDDSSYGLQWSLMGAPGGINMEPAWNLERGSTGVTVGIVDTGYQTHPDFDASRVVAEYDFIDDLLDANDGGGRDIFATDPGDGTDANECGDGAPQSASSWHGTSVAGLIAATTDNATDIAGIVHSGKLVIGRALGKCGGILSDTADAMRWAAGIAIDGVPINPNPAVVINLSLAGPGDCTPFEQQAINDTIAAGAVVVVAAGNDGDSANNISPANCKGVITVAATDRNGSLADYSNFGASVDVSAPGGSFAGGGIISLSNDGFHEPGTADLSSLIGTSMATSHVTAVIALMKAANPSLSPTRLKTLLINNTRVFPDVSCNTNLCGSGIIDAAAAIQAALNATTSSSGGGCTINAMQNPDGSLLILLTGVLLFRIGYRSKQ